MLFTIYLLAAHRLFENLLDIEAKFGELVKFGKNH